MIRNTIKIILGTLLLTSIPACKGKFEFGRSTSDMVAVEEAKTRTVEERVNAQGTLFSQTEIKVSSEVSGEIIYLKVKEGEWVNEGQLLIEINPVIYKTQIEQTQAQVNQMKANLATMKARSRQISAQFSIAELDFSRKDALYKQGVISIQEYNQAESQFLQTKGEKEAAAENINAATFQLANAEAAYKQSLESFQRTKIYAPMSGTISKLNVELGERVVGTAQMTGTELMRISDLNNMEARVDVSENDIVKVNIGDEAEVEIESFGDKKFKGIVTQKAFSSNQNAMITDKVTNFTVRIKLDKNAASEVAAVNKEEKFPFRPGMTAAAYIITDRQENALSVPLTAVTLRENEKDKEKSDEVVFVVQQDKAIKKKVKTGIQNDDYIVIAEGIKAGEKVIYAPNRLLAKTLKDQDKVEVVDEEKLNKQKSGE